MTRNTNIECFDYKVISGAVADTTVKASSGVLARVRVWAAGDATSAVLLYDGTVAAGTLFDTLAGTAVGTSELRVYCKSSIHVATVNPDTNMRVTIEYL